MVDWSAMVECVVVCTADRYSNTARKTHNWAGNSLERERAHVNFSMGASL